MLNIRQEATATTFNLPAQLDLRAAKPLKETLASCLGKGQDMVIDASKVVNMSTAAAQVIVAFILAARDATCRIRVTPISPAFQNAFELLGLLPVLEEPK